jgi:thioredoxin 1
MPDSRHRILVFTAPWCAPCKALTPTWDALRAHADVELIDVEQRPGLAEQFGVCGLPTVVVQRDGEMVDYVGPFAAQAPGLLRRITDVIGGGA